MKIQNVSSANYNISYEGRIPKFKLRHMRLSDKYITNFVDAMIEGAKVPEKQTSGIYTRLFVTTEEIPIAIKNAGKDQTFKSWLVHSICPSDNYCIFLHGGTSNVSDKQYQKLYAKLSDYDINVLAVEYPGYGVNKELKATVDTYTESAEAAYKYLTEVLKVPAEKISVMGYCIGGYAAANLARKFKCNSLFLISPMTSLIQTGEGYLKSKNLTRNFSFIQKLLSKSMLFKFKLMNKFNTNKILNEVDTPVYMFSSYKDVVFDIKWLDKLARKLRQSEKEITYFSGYGQGHKFTDRKINLAADILARDVYGAEPLQMRY